MSRYRLLVFDWDGTLSDSLASIALSLTTAYEDCQLPSPKKEKIYPLVGLDLFSMVKTLTPRLSASQVHHLIGRYRYHYALGLSQSVLFEGVKPMLGQLKKQDLLLAIATGKSVRGLRDALEQHQLTTAFAMTRCAEQCFSKPHPQMLYEIMDALGASPEQTLMIGDSVFDLQLANNAKVDFIGVSQASSHHESLKREGARTIVSHVTQITEYL